MICISSINGVNQLTQSILRPIFNKLYQSLTLFIKIKMANGINFFRKVLKRTYDDIFNKPRYIEFNVYFSL